MLLLTQCSLSVLIPLNLSWKISGCAPATFFFEHSKFGKGSLCYPSILLFLLPFMYNFILLLITKEFIQPKWSLWHSVNLMQQPGRDKYAGFLVSTQHMYVLCIFNLGCVQVNIKRTNILHKCSKCHRVRAPRFKKTCSSAKIIS